VKKREQEMEDEFEIVQNDVPPNAAKPVDVEH